MVRQYVGETLHEPQCEQPLTPQQVVSPILSHPAGGGRGHGGLHHKVLLPRRSEPTELCRSRAEGLFASLFKFTSSSDSGLGSSFKMFIHSTPMIWFAEVLWCLTFWLSSVKLIQNFLSKRFPLWWVSLRGFLPAVRGHQQAGGDGADHRVELGTAAASNTESGGCSLR